MNMDMILLPLKYYDGYMHQILRTNVTNTTLNRRCMYEYEACIVYRKYKYWIKILGGGIKYWDW